jgi:hypothetical protein
VPLEILLALAGDHDSRLRAAVARKNKLTDELFKFPIHGIISTLGFLFACDAVISFGFLLLHCLQWIVSGRVES